MSSPTRVGLKISSTRPSGLRLTRLMSCRLEDSRAKFKLNPVALEITRLELKREWFGSGRNSTPSAVPSPGGRSRRGARHHNDLPEGYHTAPRAQAWQGRRRLGGELLPGCRAVGRCQVEEMALAPRAWGRSIPGAGPVSVADTRRHGVARTRSSDGMERHESASGGRPRPGSGRRGRRFKSCHPDHANGLVRSFWQRPDRPFCCSWRD